MVAACMRATDGPVASRLLSGQPAKRIETHSRVEIEAEDRLIGQALERAVLP